MKDAFSIIYILTLFLSPQNEVRKRWGESFTLSGEPCQSLLPIFIFLCIMKWTCLIFFSEVHNWHGRVYFDLLYRPVHISLILQTSTNAQVRGSCQVRDSYQFSFCSHWLLYYISLSYLISLIVWFVVHVREMNAGATRYSFWLECGCCTRCTDDRSSLAGAKCRIRSCTCSLSILYKVVVPACSLCIGME